VISDGDGLDVSCVRVAAVSDLHFHAGMRGMFAKRWAGLGDEADLFVLCGDLTLKGAVFEARHLAAELANVNVPIVAVLGNHDFDDGAESEIAGLLRQRGVMVLDGQAASFKVRNIEVGVAGAKGFCGGFRGAHVREIGESVMKQFVEEGAREAAKLESALASVRGDVKLAVMHYAPIEATVAGEPPELFPLLGDFRLEEAIDRSGADMALHGHAHRGASSGATRAGIPVHNVAFPIHRQPFRILVIEPRKTVP
jgi:Icc-related predicted phosphoesterase